MSSLRVTPRRRALALLAIASCLASNAVLPSAAQEAPAAATPAPAAVPPPVPTDPSAVAAAVELMSVIGASNNFDNMLNMLKTHVTAGASDEAAQKAATETFEKLIAQFGTYKTQMLDETAALYASKFTTAELKSVTDFYKSGAGRKFIAEMPVLMEEAANIGQRFAVQMMKDLKTAKEAK